MSCPNWHESSAANHLIKLLSNWLTVEVRGSAICAHPVPALWRNIVAYFEKMRLRNGRITNKHGGAIPVFGLVPKYECFDLNRITISRAASARANKTSKRIESIIYWRRIITVGRACTTYFANRPSETRIHVIKIVWLRERAHVNTFRPQIWKQALNHFHCPTHMQIARRWGKTFPSNAG